MWYLISVFVIFNGLVDHHSIKIIISAIKVVYDLEVLVQIDTACARVSKLDLSSSSQQWGPHFPGIFFYTAMYSR